jgi:ribosomal protein L22
MSETPDNETPEETEDLVATPEEESTTPPAGDELQAAVEASAEPVDDESADAEPADAEAGDADTPVLDEAAEAADEPVAEEAPKPRRRRRRGAEAEEAAAEPDKPKTPAPTRRRGQRDPSLPAPVVRAQAKYVRSSARKARLVCDHIRGKSVGEARAILALTPRAIARDWSKLLESAVANAEHNHELVGEDLYVKAVHADEGPTIKRFRPRAQGRATRILKRTSHLTILLTPKD